MPPPYRTTRSHENEDAHRDFDDFDVNVELENLRSALAQPTPSLEFVREAFGNIDEWLRRHGMFPRDWLPEEAVSNPILNPEQESIVDDLLEGVMGRPPTLTDVEEEEMLNEVFGAASRERQPFERQPENTAVGVHKLRRDLAEAFPQEPVRGPTLWEHLDDDDE